MRSSYREFIPALRYIFAIPAVGPIWILVAADANSHSAVDSECRAPCHAAMQHE